MSSIDPGHAGAFAFAFPLLYASVGAWLSQLGTCEGPWDDFFSTCPFASIGALMAVGWTMNFGA